MPRSNGSPGMEYVGDVPRDQVYVPPAPALAVHPPNRHGVIPPPTTPPQPAASGLFVVLPALSEMDAPAFMLRPAFRSNTSVTPSPMTRPLLLMSSDPEM